MVENRKRRAALGTCPFYLLRTHLNPAAWCKHLTSKLAAASEAHWKEGSLPVGMHAPGAFWKEPVLLKNAIMNLLQQAYIADSDR